jgi:chitodextrinase
MSTSTLTLANGQRVVIQPKKVNNTVRPPLRSMWWNESGGQHQEEAWFQDVSEEETELRF